MILHSSELIINPDGSIYHLNVHPEDIADLIITVGDPDRVKMISKYMSKVTTEKRKREFYTITGWIEGKEVTVIGTGIGTDNIDIVLSELDAVVNIDFKSRKVKEKKRQLTFCRIGTSGSLRDEIEVESVVASYAAIGMEGLMHYYSLPQSDVENMISLEVKRRIEDDLPDVVPYTVMSTWSCWDKIPSQIIKGITLTAGGFYGPQGRALRLRPRDPYFLNKMEQVHWNGIPVTNLEMETSAIYGLSRLMGHEAVSFNVILANRKTGHFCKNPKKAVEQLIEKVLGIIL